MKRLVLAVLATTFILLGLGLWWLAGPVIHPEPPLEQVLGD